eukprot:2627891-Pleurochrysis_carterae.AAC.1
MDHSVAANCVWVPRESTHSAVLLPRPHDSTAACGEHQLKECLCTAVDYVHYHDGYKCKRSFNSSRGCRERAQPAALTEETCSKWGLYWRLGVYLQA